MLSEISARVVVNLVSMKEIVYHYDGQCYQVEKV